MLFWSLTPPFSRAVYVPDANDYGSPGAWVPLSPGDTAPPSGPDTSLDGNNVEVWRAQFISARDSGAIVFWSGGSWVVSGVIQTFNGIWHVAGAGDADNDGIPEDIDPFPGDPTNNSFYWAGGAFTRYYPNVGNIYHLFRAGWFAGAATDMNGDTLPDVLDDWFTNPSGHGTLQQFPGGTFLIQGAYSTFDPFRYYAATWADADGDLLPDEVDPFPSDAWNSTHYDWPGGDFYIDGALTHFAAAHYNGLLVDTDTGGGDGIPDVADPYPLDPANNSALWQGGQFTIDFVTQNLPARWHRADAADADGDYIPDDIDPYLNDAGNPSLLPGQFYWLGGTFRIDGQLATFAEGLYTGSSGDPDTDGLPDLLDAWPQDNTNNSAWWPGGTFTISGDSVVLAGQWHHANSGDQDFDTIPDDLDPFPADPNNGTTPTYYWAGGSFYINGLSVTFAGQNYTGDFNDPDGDGLPDFADIYPNDPSNNSFNWSGGEFTIHDIFVRFGPGWYAGVAADNNNNNVPDSLDDWFTDPSPHGQFRDWVGGTFACDGQPCTWPELKYYAETLNDADLDTIPDEIDPYPADENNHSGYTWPAAELTILYGNVQTTFSPTLYDGVFADADNDTIPDAAELSQWVNDEWNGNDSDGDLIPDKIEVQYPGVLDRADPADATSARPQDGITYQRLYLYNVEAATLSEPLAAVTLNDSFPARDSDADSMADAYELRYALNPFNKVDALGSPAGDLVFNFEKAAAALDPLTVVEVSIYPSITGQNYADALSHHDSGKDAKENDWDGDLVSNIDELFLFNTSARDASLRPSDAEIITAITGGQLLSVTTLINFQYLVTPCSCSNDNCPHTITCNSATHGSGCACDYPPPPPPCACSNNLTCPHTSSCVCSSDCFPPPPPSCACGGNTCVSPSTCSCGGGAGSLICHVAPFCICGADGCSGSGCGCNGGGTCGGGPPPFEFSTSPTLPSVFIGGSFSYQIGVQGGDTSQSVMFSLVAPSAPPPGLSISAEGLLSGTPDVEGSSSFTVRASQGSGLITRTFSLLVTAVPIALEIPDSTAVISGHAESPIPTLQFVISGTYTPPLTFSAPSLPAGITLSSSGLLSGQAATPCSQVVQVNITDADGHMGTGTFNLHIQNKIVILPPEPKKRPDGTCDCAHRNSNLCTCGTSNACVGDECHQCSCQWKVTIPNPPDLNQHYCSCADDICARESTECGKCKCSNPTCVCTKPDGCFPQVIDCNKNYGGVCDTTACMYGCNATVPPTPLPVGVPPPETCACANTTCLPLGTSGTGGSGTPLPIIELRQPRLNPDGSGGSYETVTAVRFCRWRDAFTDSGQIEPDFIASDPDRVVVRISADSIDLAKPHAVTVKVEGIVGVIGHSSDTGRLSLTPNGAYWESEPLIFVADPADDEGYNGAAGLGAANDGESSADPIDHDQTRLAGFGARIIVGYYPKDKPGVAVVQAGKMMMPLKTVKVALNIVTRNGSPAPDDKKQRVEADFYTAKLIYRQIGYDLDQQGAVSDLALPPAVQNLIQASGWLDGFATTPASATPPNKNMLGYLASLPANGAYQLYWFEVTQYKSTENKSAVGESFYIPGDAALIVWGAVGSGGTTAHELGHCMGLYHAVGENPRLLMYDGTEAQDWANNHRDFKRFHRSNDIPSPQH